MKMVLVAILTAGIPFWLSTLAEAGQESPDCQARAVVLTGGEPAEWVSDDGVVHAVGEGKMIFVTEAAGDKDGRSEKKEKKVVRIQRAPSSDDEGAENRGWLGVSIAAVPEALADQLGTGGQGILVQDVLKDSPAERAGLQVHDVILSVSGKPVDDLSALVEQVRSRQPGDALAMVVLRNGKEQAVTAVLAERPAPEEMTLIWNSADAPDAEVEDEVRTRGRFIFKGPEGKWEFKDLGDLENLKDLPTDVHVMIPKSGKRTTKVFIEDGEKVIETTVERDGRTIAIEQEGEAITVTRTDEEGEESVATYDSRDELRDADPEAFEVLNDAGHVIMIQGGDDEDGGLHFDFDLNFDDENGFQFDADALHGHALVWQEKLEEGLSEARQAYEEAMEELSRIREEWNLRGLPGFSPDDETVAPPQMKMFRTLGKPKHSFEVRTDGTIEVRIRDGGSELVQLFSDEDDLSARRPDLAEKFRRLMEADE